MTNAAPRLTIGMPVYNGAKDLARALDCILEQSFQDFKIVISNNGSKDGTASICAAYAAKDPRITVYTQPVTLNATQNFCFVRDKADTEYFAWAAHDDMRDNDYFEKLVATLDTNKNAILAFGDILQVDPQNGDTETIILDFTQEGKSTPCRMWWTATHPMHNLYGVWRTAAVQEILWKHSPWSLDTTLMMAATAMGHYAYAPGTKLHYLNNLHPFLPAKPTPAILFAKTGQILHLIGTTAIAVNSVKGPAYAILAVGMVIARTIRQAVIFAGNRIKRRIKG